ncbi:hypothetical protein [Salinisphaera sp. LB1]|uniref:hypothetical protein n=1 Tax=Salinisphaera sp. LB1 TaxID=2183911 RepID=UPI000D7076EB|nr:hypothetical protein [Salinisphaera sp. LB1]
MRSVAIYAVAALVAASALLSGCAALSNGGDGHHKLARQAGAFKATPAARNADDRQRLTEALATIYADSTVHPLRYHARFVDLNGDGKREAVVYVTGPSGCAQGCDLYVLARNGDRYEAVSRIPTARAPLYELDQRHHGWHDLWVTTVGDAGGSHGQRMQYAGGGYVPVDDNGAAAARTPLIPNLDGPGHAIPASGHGQ